MESLFEDVTGRLQSLDTKLERFNDRIAELEKAQEADNSNQVGSAFNHVGGSALREGTVSHDFGNFASDDIQSEFRRIHYSRLKSRWIYVY